MRTQLLALIFCLLAAGEAGAGGMETTDPGAPGATVRCVENGLPKVPVSWTLGQAVALPYSCDGELHFTFSGVVAVGDSRDASWEVREARIILIERVWAARTYVMDAREYPVIVLRDELTTVVVGVGTAR